MNSTIKSTGRISPQIYKDTADPAASDLAIARSTILAILPQHQPAIEGVEAATLYQPGSALTGSLFDIVPISEELFAFVIFDVGGNGVSAALRLSTAKVLFSNYIRTATSPRVVMDRVCSDMAEYMGQACFAAAFIGYLDLHGNRLTYCNYGYTCSAVFRAKEQELVFLKSSDTGIKRALDDKNILLNPGDWFIMFTSGFESFIGTSHPPHDGESFAGALQAFMQGCGPADCLAQIQERHQALTQTRQLDTDIAVVAVQMLTQSRRNLLKKELGFEPGDPVYLQYLNYFEEMDKTIGVVLKAMDNQGYADDTIRKMKITLTELLVNALHHGNKKDPLKKVILGHIVDKNKSVISILDEGDGFNPSIVPDPTLPENLIKDSGRGLYIVRCYVDDLQFNEKGNRVTIVKRGTARR